MASGLAPPLRRLQRKLTLAVWLGRLARQGSLVLALAGCAILVARAGFEVESERARWLLLPLAAVPFTAWAGVRARIPSKAGAVAWLDLRSGGSGQLLTDYERQDERWEGRLDSQLDRLPELPAIRVGSFARPMLPALVFALLALFVPLTRAEPGPSSGFLDSAIAGLVAQLDTLTDIAGLDDELQEELAKRLEDLSENADTREPEAMLEAIDSLSEAMQREGETVAERAQDLLERLGVSESQAGLHSLFAQKLLESGLKEMLQMGLSPELLEQIQSLAPELAKNIDGKQLNMPPGLQLDPELMAKLSQLLRDRLRSDLGELDLAGLIDLKDLKLGDGPRDLADLIAQFHEHDESCEKPGGT